VGNAFVRGIQNAISAAAISASVPPKPRQLLAG